MRLLLTICSILPAFAAAWAQDRVQNVRIRVLDSAQIEVRYDLINARPGDSVYVAMESRLRGELRLLPEYIRGDVGRRVTAGNDRRIVWDALANGYSLNEDIRATVLVKASLATDRPAPSTPVIADKPNVTTTNPAPAKSEDAVPPAMTNPGQSASTPESAVKRRYAGPAWALLSAVAPGVGNMFVQMPRPKIGLRPLVTVGCYGLLIYGLSERRKSRDEYTIYEQQKNAKDAEPYYQSANNHHHTYILATRGALVVAAADVILTFMKGVRNSRLQREARQESPVSLRPGLQAGQPTAVVRYSF
ncbi:hypothetical protein [Spirosoma koreense]